jgi:transposase InsO family protein
MKRGFVYLTVVLDWYSRRVLSHRISITMDTSFCLDALEEAIAMYGKPEIMNTDQGVIPPLIAVPLSRILMQQAPASVSG